MNENISTPTSDNIKALNRLRNLPRGTQVESRINAIKALLGEQEVIQTLQYLRWPQGVVCPNCLSSRVKLRKSPADAPDTRQYYICLSCQENSGGQEGGGFFDDFTGLPIETIKALTQWILCWYLVGFCSLGQISKILNVPISDVAKMAAIGAEITLLPENYNAEMKLQQFYQKDKLLQKNKKAQLEAENLEEAAKSEGRDVFKPRYKSKK